jgi:hypothetical protein
MHGLHEQVLAYAGGGLAILAVLALAIAAAREKLHTILTNCRLIAKDIRGKESLPNPPLDPLHRLFPKQRPARQTTKLREGCHHTFCEFLDGSVPRPQQLGALTFGCVNCGWKLKTKEDLQEFSDYISSR